MEINLTAVLFGLKDSQVWWEIYGESTQSGTIVINEWTQIVSVNTLTEFDIYINAAKVTDAPVSISSPFIDDLENSHDIGKDYTGFIYQICIYQYSTVPAIETGQCGNDQSVTSPPGACLYECGQNEYYEDDSCQPCKDTCTHGCIRPSDCRN